MAILYNMVCGVLAVIQSNHQYLAQTKEKLCKVIPKYAKNVNKNTIIEILQNCCKYQKYSKIKHLERLCNNDKNTFHLPRQHLP